MENDPEHLQNRLARLTREELGGSPAEDPADPVDTTPESPIEPETTPEEGEQ